MKTSVNFSNLEINISVRVNGNCDHYHSYRREENHVSSHNDKTEYENATADINLSLNGGIETDTPEELIKMVVDLVKDTIISQGKKSYVEKVTPDPEKQEDDEDDKGTNESEGESETYPVFDLSKDKASDEDF